MSTERFSSADWFKFKKNITVVGCGSIGHTLAKMLAVYGHNVTVYDGDVVGPENVFVQGFTISDLLIKKVDALSDGMFDYVNDYSNLTTIDSHWQPGDVLEDIVIMAVDSIDVRKQLFEDIIKKDDFMFIDARVGAEYFQLYHVTKDHIDDYRNSLFVNDEAAPVNCTYKMTRHVAQICQGYIVSLLNQYIVNKELFKDEVLPHQFYREFNASTL